MVDKHFPIWDFAFYIVLKHIPFPPFQLPMNWWGMVSRGSCGPPCLLYVVCFQSLPLEPLLWVSDALGSGQWPEQTICPRYRGTVLEGTPGLCEMVVYLINKMRQANIFCDLYQYLPNFFHFLTSLKHLTVSEYHLYCHFLSSRHCFLLKAQSEPKACSHYSTGK